MQLEELSLFIAQRFIARTDVMAVQRSNGSYAPIQEGFTLGAIEDHILGKRRLGHYLLNNDHRCRLAAFDLDFEEGGVGIPRCPEDEDPQPWSPAEALRDQASPLRPRAILYIRSLAESLAEIAAVRKKVVSDVIIGFSGNKGLHVYLLFQKLVSAQVAQSVTHDIILEFNQPFSGKSEPAFSPKRGVNFWSARSYPGLTIECFPKQGKKTRYGNLMRLPYGTHAKSGQQGFFIDRNAPMDELRPLLELP